MLFAGFLERNGISNESASRALGVSRVTVGQWACGDKRPAGHNPRKVAMWTSGAVPEDSWNDPRETVVHVEPYRPADADDDAPPESHDSTPERDLAAGE